MTVTVAAKKPDVTVVISPLAEDAETQDREQERFSNPSDSLSKSRKYLITCSLLLANLIQFVSNVYTYAGGLALTQALGHSPDEANWMAASYALTQGAFVLITGRLGEIYGHQNLALLGVVLFTVFTFLNAAANQYEAFIVMRALTGMSAGIFMPNAVASITIMTPPGRSRNLLMGLFAASPPFGCGLGAFVSGGFTPPNLHWRYAFILIGGVSLLMAVTLALLLPKEKPSDEKGSIDYVGAALGLLSLLLFNISWNQAPSAGWATPYEIALLVISVASFVLFLIWESKFAKDPVMPLSIFQTPTFGAVLIVVLLSYMAYGVALWYAISWQQVLRHESVMTVAYHFIPFAVTSVLAVGVAAWLIPRIAAQWILAIGVSVILVANIILATMPVKQTFWAQAFPSMVLIGISPDFVYVAAQLIASNSVSRRQQGVASSLVGTLNLYGNSLGLGFAGTVQSRVAQAKGPVSGYRSALYFGAGLALLSLILNFVFVRMPKDEREGWDDGSTEEGS